MCFGNRRIFLDQPEHKMREELILHTLFYIFRKSYVQTVHTYIWVYMCRHTYVFYIYANMYACMSGFVIKEST